MRTTSAILVMLVIWAGTTAYGQRVNRPEEYEQAMKTVDAAVNAARKTIAAGQYADAKVPVVLARQTLAASTPFWSVKKTDRAVALTRDAVRTLDDSDAALSSPDVDAGTIQKALSKLNETCNTCHDAYREGDSKSGYRIKTGFE